MTKKPHKCARGFQGKCRACDAYWPDIEFYAPGAMSWTGSGGAVGADGQAHEEAARRVGRLDGQQGRGTCDTHEDGATEGDESRTGLCQRSSRRTTAGASRSSGAARSTSTAGRRRRRTAAPATGSTARPTRRRRRRPAAAAESGAAAADAVPALGAADAADAAAAVAGAADAAAAVAAARLPLILLSVSGSEPDSKGIVDHETFYHIDFEGGNVKEARSRAGCASTPSSTKTSSARAAWDSSTTMVERSRARETRRARCGKTSS